MIICKSKVFNGLLKVKPKMEFAATLTFLINGEVLIIGEGGKFPKWGG